MKKRNSSNLHVNRSNTQSDKFALQLTTLTNNSNGNISNGSTFIDGIIKKLEEKKIEGDDIDAFIKIISDEEYDSEGIVADVIGYEYGSNIINIVNNQQFTLFITDFMEIVTSMFALHLQNKSQSTFFLQSFSSLHSFFALLKQTYNSK